MNSKIIKAVTALLAFSMVLPLASCGKKKGGASGKKTISDDTPWFDTALYDVDQGLNQEREMEYVYSDYVGSDENNIIVLTSGNYKIPDKIDWATYNYSDYAISVLTIVDRATKKTVRTIDLSTKLKDSDYAENARYSDGKITVIYTSIEDKTWETLVKEMDIDIATGEITDTRDLGKTGIYRKTFRLGDYTADSEMVWSSNLSYAILNVTSPDGSKKKIEIKEDRNSIYEISAVLPLSNTTALVITYADNGSAYFIADLQSGTITKTDAKDYDWIDLGMLYSTFNGSDGNVYYATPAGISKINLKEKTDTEMFNYSWCGINRNILTNLQIAEISEDAFLLCGTQYNDNPFSEFPERNGTFYMVEFNRAEKNPHAGKTILEMYSSYGYMDDKIADAVIEFNETNKDYFIEVTDRYRNIANYSYSDLNSDDELDAQQLNYNAEMSSKLAMDILNGEGPDMLMDVNAYGQLKNPEYLADLTPYIGKLDPSKYFTNILDAAKTDGKLYNFPVCYTVEGIQTDAQYAGSSGVGFTTDEYVKFLKDTLNGTDVIPSGQTMYFAKLFNSMSDRYIVNGKADFSDPSLKALAEFVKDNVRGKSTDWDEQDNEGRYSTYAINGYNLSDTGLAAYTWCGSYYSYFRNLENLNGSTAILGLPSADGHGPAAGQYTSIAVSAQAVSVDACGEFIKMLMSDKVQEEIAMHGNFVLNKDAFRKAGLAAVDYYNEQGGVDVDRYDEYGNKIPPRNKLNFSESQVDALADIISSCEFMDSGDAAINIVLVEEMQPYFAGQKDLDQVLSVAQDRVQKVLDERG